MRFAKHWVLSAVIFAAGCGPAPSSVAINQGGGGTGGASVNFSGMTFAPTGTYTANTLAVYVNGSDSAGCGTANPQYPNEPCVSVTLCSPSDPTNCQTINDILLDTGSYGLRVFKSLITVPLQPITNGSYSLAECVQYLDGSSQWGPVEYAYVGVGGEPLVGVPIEAIDYSFGSPASPCVSPNSDPDISPSSTRFNGILGVGLDTQDCGTACTTSGSAGFYYACNGGNCSTRATVALSAQVTNPVSALPTDNNGVVLAMNSVPAGGVTASTGTLYFGIGTRSNNTASGTAFQVNPSALEFYTNYPSFSSSELFGGFIDSGSNTLLFPKPSSGIYDCSSSSYSGWFCGSAADSSGTLVSSSAVNYAVSGSSYNPSIHSSVSFSVGNASTLLPTTNLVFSELGLDSGTSSPLFDWGLPFFFGKTVYVGISGRSATGFSAGASTGPYWAWH